MPQHSYNLVTSNAMSPSGEDGSCGGELNAIVGPGQAYPYENTQFDQQIQFESVGSNNPDFTLYGYDAVLGTQPSELRPNIDSMLAHDIDFTNIQQFVRAPDIQPYVVGLPRHQPAFSSFGIAPTADRPHTVTGPLSGEAYRRPSFEPRDSYLSTQDSGYKSNTAPSETQESIAPKPNAGASALPFQIDRPAPAASVKSAPEPGRRQRSKPSSGKCTICNRVLKNKSDETKHRFQHEKPYRCREPGCTRKGGFGTQNDLERHRKSVHGVQPRVGKRLEWICRGCPPPSRGASAKRWPRLDNFKAHIKRKHPGVSEPQLIKDSEISQPQHVPSESGYGDSQVVEDHFYQDLASPMTPNKLWNESYQEEQPSYLFDQNPSDSLVGIGSGQEPSVSSFQGQAYSLDDRNYSMYSLRVAPSQHSNLQVNTALLPPQSFQVAAPRPANLDDASVGADHLSALHLNDQPSKRQKATSTLDSYHSDLPESGESYKCPHCPKVRKRKCDLHKHLKRHTRPYGCTFPGCSMRLGSRNDWKRHESSQHHLLDMWRCSQCAFVAHSKHKFSHHLQQKHGILSNSHQAEEVCRASHLGKDGHFRFWCGFCQRLIPQQLDSMMQGNSPPLNAWEYRLQHVGDHYDKDKRNIDTWVDLEPYRPAHLNLCERTGRSGSRLSDDSSDFENDDSDLGEDGIPDLAFRVPGDDTAPGAHNPSISNGSDWQTTMLPNIMSNNAMRFYNDTADADGEFDDEFPC